MKHKIFSRKIIALSTLAFLLPSAAFSQMLGLLTLERLSLLDISGTGARPFAMGGSYIAVSDDVYALLYNPAGLAQLEEREISFGIHHGSPDVEHIYEGTAGSTSNSTTSLGHLALCFPYNEYRKSIVFGAGVFRAGSSDLEYVRNAVRSDENIDGSISNAFLQSGSIYQYRLGVGARISPMVSVGAVLVIWDESVEFVETIGFEGAGDSSYVFIADVAGELDGISVELGLLLHFNDYLRAGITMSTPSMLDWNSENTETYEGTYQDGSGWYINPLYFYDDDEFTLPMRFSGGLAFETRQLLLCADMTYSDYSQTSYNGLKLINENDPGRDVLEPAFDFRFGAELRIPGTPFNARCGFAWMPLRFKGFDEMTYVFETADEIELRTEYDFYEIVDERRFFSFGIGGLIDDVLMLDLGLRFGSFKRSSPYLAEKRDITEVAASASYRF